MQFIYITGIFISVAAGIAGLYAFVSDQRKKGDGDRFIRVMTVVFVVSLVITLVTYFIQYPSAGKTADGSKGSSIGLYIANGSQSRPVYFHNAADPATRREAFINSKVEVMVHEVKNGFGYVEFRNTQGQPSIGWLPMEQLVEKP